MKIEKTGTPESTNPGATNGGSFSLDATDLAILALLQENCRRPLAEIGKRVGLSSTLRADLFNDVLDVLCPTFINNQNRILGLDNY